MNGKLDLSPGRWNVYDGTPGTHPPAGRPLLFLGFNMCGEPMITALPARYTNFLCEPGSDAELLAPEGAHSLLAPRTKWLELERDIVPAWMELLNQVDLTPELVINMKLKHVYNLDTFCILQDNPPGWDGKRSHNLTVDIIRDKARRVKEGSDD